MRTLTPPRSMGGNGTGGGIDPLIQNFEKIRGDYQNRVNNTSPVDTARITPTNGTFFRNSTDYQVLTERHGGVDKLFLTLVMGIVEDPDFALRKDPQIYQRMMRDPQIFYCLMVRRTATSALPWQVVPPDQYSQEPAAMQLAEAASNRIRQIPQLRRMFDNILRAFLPGMSVQELVWQVNERGEYIVNNHYPMDKDRFKFDRDGRLQLLQPRSPVTGVEVPQYKYITHRFQVQDGSWKTPSDYGYVYYGQGLADTPLYHYFYFKVTALRYMLKSLERNSSPFKVYYTGPQNAALAAKLDSILAALQNDSVVGIPGKKGETNVDVAAIKGGADLYIAFIEYVDRLITRAILGQDLMTEMPQVGSYAAAQVHASVFNKIAETDRDGLQDTLNASLMQYDAQLNTPQAPKELWPVFKFKSDALVDAGNFLAMVGQALQMGLMVSENQVRELTGLREPTPTEKVLGPETLAAMQQLMAPPDDQGGAPGKGKSAKPSDAKKSDSKNGNGKAKSADKKAKAE